MQGTFNRSQVDFDAWSKMPHDPEQIEREMQTQKKRMYKETPPFRMTFREVPKSYLSHNTIKEGSLEEEAQMLVVHNMEVPEPHPAVNNVEMPSEPQPVAVGAS